MSDQTATGVALPDVPSAESEYREVNGVELHTVVAGEESDPLVVLLHGFPEFWYGWHRQLAPLVDAGYRVLVPDQRGYNGSEKPEGIDAYRVTELVDDVVGLVDTEGRDSAHVVGHDWGAIVAWQLALRRPEVLDRLGIVNVPHPLAFEETLRSNPRQLLKSWYVFYFQLPVLPEWLSARDDFAFWVDALRGGARPDTFSDEDIEHYRAAWSQSGAPTAMINWYRALVRRPQGLPRERVSAPTLVIWGEDDQALEPELAPKSVEYCDDARLEQFSDATHWINHEHPERVSNLLLEHLAE
jgi:pimeloyl-ACP methyl ester carboxylesterase